MGGSNRSSIDPKWVKKYPKAFRRECYSGWILRKEFSHLAFEINEEATLETELKDIYWPSGVHMTALLNTFGLKVRFLRIKDILTSDFYNRFRFGKNVGPKLLEKYQNFLEGLGFKTEWHGAEPMRTRVYLECPHCHKRAIKKNFIETKTFGPIE